MGRDQEVQFEQDNLGNERRKLDTLRAQEGNSGADGTTGIVEITSADTGTTILLSDLSDHTDEAYVTDLDFYNQNTAGGTATLFEVEANSNNSVTSSTRRSVPFTVGSASTAQYEYSGDSFEDDIGIQANFTGWVGVGFISDSKEFVESSTEQTN